MRRYDSGAKRKGYKAESTAFIWLALILYIGAILFGIVVGLGFYLKGRDREFQDLVLISGVMDSLETVPPNYEEAWLVDMILGPRLHAKIMGLPTDESGHPINELRLRLQGDPHLYVVGSIVFGGFNWEKFSANESVGARVSLKVERANLSQWKPSGWRRKIMVYGLESSRGTYLTPEDSLNSMRASDFVVLIIISGVGVILLIPVVLGWFSGWQKRPRWRKLSRRKLRRIRQHSKGATRDPFISP